MEVLIVVAIIGIIAAIAIPLYQRYQIRTQASAALAEASALRVPVEAQVLGIGPPAQLGAASLTLEIPGDDTATITALRTLGQLTLVRDDNGRWVCEHNFATVLPGCRGSALGSRTSGLTAFAGPDSYRNIGGWESNDDTLRSGNGRLYIPNTDEEYDFTVQATLGGDSGGGFGLLFDIALPDDNDNHDSGFVLQYDRGWGGFVIRERTGNGGESNGITLSGAQVPAGSEFINRGGGSENVLRPPAFTNDADWWSQQRDITVQVRNGSDPNTRSLAVIMDGEEMFSGLQIDSGGGEFVGLRSWGSETEYSGYSITPP